MTKDNISNDNFQQLKLLSLKEDAELYGGLWEEWHELADIRHQPAKEFFIERLQDIRSEWRSASLSLLGSHYDLEEDILVQIRELLISDPDAGVRIAAASVLGHQSKLPDKPLVQALVHDSKRLVREAAFSALLELGDVPYLIKLHELEKVESGEITPSIDEVKRIFIDCGLLPSIDMLADKS